MTAPAACVLVAGALVFGAAACGGDGEREPDEEAFCEAFERLDEDDPFEALGDVFEPAELRTAFTVLADGARELDRHAPGEVAPAAGRLVAAVAELRDQLAGAGYDARLLDPTRYGAAVTEYERTARRLEAAATRLCP